MAHRQKPATASGRRSPTATSMATGLATLLWARPERACRVQPNQGASRSSVGGQTASKSDQARRSPKPGAWPGAAEAGDHCGQAVALADFDGDGYDDLAVGAPDEGVSGMANACAVTIMYRTSAGLTTENSKAFSQAGKVGGSLEPGDGFGSALAVGDFNGDGFADLAIGSPRETVNGNANAGAVTIMFGTSAGLRSANSLYFTQRGNVPGDNGAGDFFGEVLTAGDFDNDGEDDLAIGIPREDLGGATNTGAVVILRGSNSALTTNGSSILSQAGAVPGSSKAGDNFGSALASGDFDNDGDDDLAIGSSGEDNKAGRVVTFNGSGSGLSFDASFTPNSLPGSTGAAGDRLGHTLRSGDFNGDGRLDLAIGAPTDGVGSSNPNDGSIVVLLGSGSGLTTSGGQAINKGTPGVSGQTANGDRWGGGL